jgi:hypothetical protein
MSLFACDWPSALRLGLCGQECQEEVLDLTADGARSVADVVNEAR